MLVPFRLRLAPGLSVASAVPVTVFLWCFTLAPLMHSSTELANTVDAAGPFAALVAVALLVELPLLSQERDGSFRAIALGAGDFRQPTELRGPPRALAPRETLAFGRQVAVGQPGELVARREPAAQYRRAARARGRADDQRCATGVPAGLIE